jgi:Holliday junction resolvase
MVSLVEAGTANFSCDLGGRLISAVGVTIDLQYQLPHAEPRQRDAAHARCVAYVQRRLERDGWLVAREIEVGSPRSHGWIDLLAFDPRTRTLLVIEVKTQLDDVGRIERTVAWYVRGAPAAAMRLGWHAEAVGSWLLVLATDANEQRLRENRLTLAQSFPRRAPELDLGPGLALIDPRSRRRAWLIHASRWASNAGALCQLRALRPFRGRVIPALPGYPPRHGTTRSRPAAPPGRSDAGRVAGPRLDPPRRDPP